MQQILNTLYVTTEGSYLHLDHDTLIIEVGGEKHMQVPLHHLGGVVCFGNIMVSPALMHRCAEDGRSFVLLDRNGRFKCRVEGPVSGNVLLRRDQHLASCDSTRPISIARNIVAGKIQNSRQVISRAGREADRPDDAARLQETARALESTLSRLQSAESLDEIRGMEGDAARAYFDSFSLMIKEDVGAFAIDGRTRRPPRDRMNALLSFLYTLLLNDIIAAVEGVGLDPQVGFLHALRPGRPALALDMIEELRAIVADRLALTLINRKQIARDDFVEREGGAVLLSDKGRKEVVIAYQKRKQNEVRHILADQKMPWGLVPHMQARLLARHLRNEMEEYPPFLYR